MNPNHRDFDVEYHPKDDKVRLVTPRSYSAIEWCSKHMRKAILWGRSYVMRQADASKLEADTSKSQGFRFRVKAA